MSRETFFFVLFLISRLKKKGINICDIITHKNTDDGNQGNRLNAGCCAKIKTPNPAMVVMAERKIDDL